jgi:hypothetical protein
MLRLGAQSAGYLRFFFNSHCFLINRTFAQHRLEDQGCEQVLAVRYCWS